MYYIVYRILKINIIGGNKKMANIRIKDELYDEIKNYCKENNIIITKQIEGIINNFLDNIYINKNKEVKNI